MSISNKKIALISITSFLALLSIAIYVDIKRGVFDKNFENKSIAKISSFNKTNKYHANNTHYKHRSRSISHKNFHSVDPFEPTKMKSYVNNDKLSKRIDRKPSSGIETMRRLEGDELLHSKAKQAYANYLEYSLQQNMPDITKFPKEDSLWLVFDINREGFVIGYDIYNANCSEEFKNAIINTLIKTAPFQPLPNEYQDDTYRAMYHFHNGGNYLNRGAVYIKQEPKLQISQKNKTNTIKITDVKLPRCNGAFPADLSQEMYSYINNLHRQIKENWKPDIDEVSDVRLSYLIDKNGKISDINIGYSKSSLKAELAAKDAILSIKAPKFPDSANCSELRLNHYFEVEANNIY